MKAVDTNVLVYAEITNSLHHSRANKLLIEFAQGSAPWAIPWPCAYEFLRDHYTSKGLPSASEH